MTMDEYLQRKVLLRAGALRCGKYRDLLAGGADHIALGQRRDAVVVLVLVDVLVVPCLGVGIVGSMAGVVQPVRPVHGRHAIENRVHRVGGGGGEMAFGDGSHGVVAFLAPRVCAQAQHGGTDQYCKAFHCFCVLCKNTN